MSQYTADGRIGRFVDSYGWRAYAVPALAALTILILVSAITTRPSSAAEPLMSAATQTPEAPLSTAPQPATEPAPVAAAPAAPTEGYLVSGTGELVTVPGVGPVVGGGGDLHTYVVQVEGGIQIDAAAFAGRVEAILADPRSWIAGGDVRFQRVDADPDLHISLVTPEHVESYCPGYQTNGYTSCRKGDRVVINLARWSVGVPDYDGALDAYRDYVINHEVGHFLGHDHVDCPAAGAKAPVMQQQTLGLDGCALNAWPYPTSPADNPEMPA